jgi:N6-L-threonylcarbamoyladenine synthase
MLPSRTPPARIVLGIETSCDETGVALYDTQAGLVAQRLHSQIAMHADYGGVVPELASRDHVRRLLPLVRAVLTDAGRPLSSVDAIAYTQGPGLAGALLVGASIAQGMGAVLGLPTIGIHHLEGHLLSPLLSSPPAQFPFLALLVSGGHTQIMRAEAVGRYELLGETVDDAAGEAFDKTAQLLGLGYPGGPALAQLAVAGDPNRFALPRPKHASGDLDFSFSGLKTAARLLIQRESDDPATRADIAAAVQEAIVSVLTDKALSAADRTGIRRLVVAGGVGANRRLRELLTANGTARGIEVTYPPLELCTDNGAMIALAGALRLAAGLADARPTPLGERRFGIRPRWELASEPAA